MQRLSRAAACAIANPRIELWLSPVSVWEVVTLTEKGRLRGIRDGDAWINLALAALPLHSAPLTTQIVREAQRIRIGTGDPTDRRLVATARIHDCRLLTEDDAIIASGLVQTLAGD